MAFQDTGRGSKPPLEAAVLKIVDLLEKLRIDYFFLGGIAVSVLGEPRFTQDVDLDVFLSKGQISTLLKKAQHEGLDFSRDQVLDTINCFGLG